MPTLAGQNLFFVIAISNLDPVFERDSFKIANIFPTEILPSTVLHYKPCEHKNYSDGRSLKTKRYQKNTDTIAWYHYSTEWNILACKTDKGSRFKLVFSGSKLQRKNK